MCKQDKVAGKKGLKEKKRFQHNIVYLFPGIPTDPDNEVFTVNGRKHTHTHTHIQVPTKSTRFNTNHHESNTCQHESIEVRHESVRVNRCQLDQKIIIFYCSLVEKV